jgi:hypothetical protein
MALVSAFLGRTWLSIPDGSGDVKDDDARAITVTSNLLALRRAFRMGVPMFPEACGTKISLVIMLDVA